MSNINWNPESQNVLLVPGSEVAAPAARKFNVYFCQNDRSFAQPFRFIAFYENSEAYENAGIYDVYEVLAAPKNNVKSVEYVEFSDYNAAYPDVINEDKTLFRLRKVESITLNIQNNAEDKTENAIQKQQYTTLSKLILAQSISELRLKET